MAQCKSVVKKGPFGSQKQENFSLQFSTHERIKEVIVRHADIVDAISFVVHYPGDLRIEGTTKFGGPGGTETSKIVLKPNEYITQISGTSQEYAWANNDRLISTIKIHTNLNPDGYGPYGKGHDATNAWKFASDMPLKGPIVGFFGRASNYLQSIGIYVEEA